ncbi:auxin transport protein BIG [Ricinus communis]|uniref:auxin transport protein BIG n=1 Tax=Ricinus communis TaxID=3988 RepID=UPI000772B0E7|nr:auxin transport protein BIG [Ricinus communis]|eukprot:XP_015578926.1 auxin transport protein BIG [Ricinus communis]
MCRCVTCLFRIGFEFADNHAYVEGSLEGLVLLLLEEFLLFAGVVFCNSNACQNILDLKRQTFQALDMKGFGTEMENAVCHKDEALFRNLLYEGSRSVGSTDGFELPLPATVNSCSSNCNLPIQATTALLSFLKENVFSHEWSPLFEDACKRLREDRI